MRPINFNKREKGVLIVGTALAIASLAPSDLYVILPMLAISEGAFVFLAYHHQGSVLNRVLSTLAITLVLFTIGYRQFLANATGVVKVYIGETTRFETTQIKFDTLEKEPPILRVALAKLMPGRPARLRSGQNAAVVNIVVRNTSAVEIRDVRVDVISTNREITGKTWGAFPFDSHQVGYELRLLRPFARLGEEYFFSIEVSTPKCKNIFAPMITVDGVNMEKFVGVAMIDFTQDPPCTE